jgi:hypothetical protein
MKTKDIAFLLIVGGVILGLCSVSGWGWLVLIGILIA